MLAGNDEFAAFAVDMAQRGFGGGNAVQTDLALGELDVHGLISFQVSKVGPLDRLINLDYVNQYEKIFGPLSVRPGSLRRARDLAGDALRLCQSWVGSLRAFTGSARPAQF